MSIYSGVSSSFPSINGELLQQVDDVLLLQDDLFLASLEKYQAERPIVDCTLSQKDSLLIDALASEGIISAVLAVGFKVIPMEDPLLKGRCERELASLYSKKIIGDFELAGLRKFLEHSPLEAACYLYEMLAARDRNLFPLHFAKETYGTGQAEYLKEHLALFLMLEHRLPDEIKSALDRNDSVLFHKSFSDFLAALCKSSDGIKRFFYEDVQENFSNTVPSHSIQQLGLFVLTDRFYRQYADKVIDLTTSFQSIPSEEDKASLSSRFEHLYRQSQLVFLEAMTKPIPSLTRFYSLVGKSEGAFRKINAYFQFKKHFLCDCHGCGRESKGIHPPSFALVQPSPSSLDKAETVAILGCSYGTGHKQAAQTTSSILERMGYHPYTLDVPENVLKGGDVITAHLTRFLGSYASDWSVGSLFNGLITRKAFAAINMLSGNDPLSGHIPTPPKEGSDRASVHRLLHHLLLINPSMIVINYYPDIAESIQAAKILNLPIIHTHTDVSPFELSWRVNTLYPQYPLFFECLAFEGYKQTIAPHVVAEENISVTGPVCNPIFDTRFSEEEILSLKQQWGIDPQRRVIVLSNGANGSTHCPPFIEGVAQQYKAYAKEDVPFHFVVICGRGNDFLSKQIERRFAGKIPISCYCFVSIDKMKQLLAMASMGGALVGKPGGLTVFECVKQGTPLIFDEMPRRAFSLSVKDSLASAVNAIAVKKGWSNILPWEADNKEFAMKHGFAKACSSSDEFVDILRHLEDEPVALPSALPGYLDKNFSIEFAALIERIEAMSKPIFK